MNSLFLAMALSAAPQVTEDCHSDHCVSDCMSCRAVVRIELGHSTCNFPPYVPYHPELHGNYYFRPYHQGHVLRHQEIAKGWGMDPRNPYSNEIFKKIYEQAEGMANTRQEMPTMVSQPLRYPAPTLPLRLTRKSQ